MTPDVPEAGDDASVRLLTMPAVRSAIFVPVAAVVVHATLTGGIRHVPLFLLLLAAGVALALPAFRAASPAGAPSVRFASGWQLLASTVGIALVAPFLLHAVDVGVERYVLLFAVVLVAGAYSSPRAVRIPLALWTVVVWMATSWAGGIRRSEVLLLHLGGALVILLASVRTADTLLAAIGQERRSRDDAEQRARLLASVLRTNSLEPDEVIRAVVRGLVDVGFDVVSVREVDREGQGLRFVAGHGLPAGAVRELLPLHDGLVGQAVRSGRPVAVDDHDHTVGRSHGGDLAGAIAVPVGPADAPAVVLFAARRDGPLTGLQREAAVLLAAQAGTALQRAVAFEADERTVAQLRELERRTQDFVSTVSHELRTPLTVIQGLGQTLHRRWADLDPVRRNDLLRRIDANAERLAVMVRSLLDTSALEEGRLDLRREPVDLHRSVRGLLHRLATVTAAHPVDLDVPTDVVVDVDPGLFEHVLENLLGNVAKHTPQGTRVRIGAEVGQAAVRITVADDGPGITAGDLPFVLDRFYRGGDPDRRASGGLGLGLALARQIVQAHGSDLTVTRNEDGGATFAFSVPIAARPPARTGSASR